MASAAAALFVVLIGATTVVLRKNHEVEAKNVEVSARKAEFDQLAGVVLLESAKASERELYPARPDRIASMRRWLANDAAKLLAMRPALSATIADLESRAEARSERAFDDESQEFLHSTLTALRSDLDTFDADLVAGVRRRLAWAERIETLTLRHPNARVTWDDARSAIAKADGVVASSRYALTPIDLKPQIGLVPIGMNPVTKLWEFYDLHSAGGGSSDETDPASLEIPTHRDDGSIEMKGETGIVFALIPGATFVQGAQKDDGSAPLFDPAAEGDEAPQSVTLAPYFMARHELKRGQWARLTGGGDSSGAPLGITYDGPTRAIGWAHPVENVSWTDCETHLPRVGLRLPTEAQWEYAARAGTEAPWWTGREPSSLSGAANVLDQRGANAQPAWGQPQGDFDDGYIALAPAGAFAANAFGMHDVHGNIGEWCADAYSGKLAEPRVGDGLRSPTTPDALFRVHRGGSFSSNAQTARAAYRMNVPPEFKSSGLGVRAARDVE
ncbi:MAG: formylglycine-generating enzyme family protein [Planctomycetes bacterium]|nr:formylglycine-generating enzyme family protein [Planctomycetota bacterium]